MGARPLRASSTTSASSCVSSDVGPDCDVRNDRLLRALRRQPVDRTPVWLMRQAGRYLPEYRALREQAGSFVALMSNPELATEVTLQPLRRFDLDAAILFADILTIPDALGLGLYFVTGEGPRFERPLRDARAIRALDAGPVEDRLDYVFETVRRVRAGLDGAVPLIGFAGSPWTIATYMVEGGSSRDFAHCKALLYDQPGLLHELLALNADATARYLIRQADAGAQALMLFDSWGGALSTPAYHEFSLAYMRQVIAALRAHPASAQLPVILFTRGGGQWLEALADSGADALGLDWTTDLGAARVRVGDRVALQGNMDPTALLAGIPAVRREARRVLDSYGSGPGHVFNLGHGLLPTTDPEHVGALVDAVHEASAA